MNIDQITVLAREYAEVQGKLDREQGFSEFFIKYMLEFNEKEFKSMLEFLLRRYCLVEKSRLEKLDIAYRAKEYDMVILDKGDVNFLFPEIAKDVEE